MGIQLRPPLLPQVSIEPVSLGAGEPAVTGVMDAEAEEAEDGAGAEEADKTTNDVSLPIVA